MHWILRIFPSLCQILNDVELLRDANRQLIQDNLRLQDRLDAALEDRKQLFALVNESVHNERASYQAQINFQSQRTGGPAIYPEAAILPRTVVPSAEDKKPVARRLMPSEIVAHRTQAFKESYLAERAAQGNG